MRTEMRISRLGDRKSGFVRRRGVWQEKRRGGRLERAKGCIREGEYGEVGATIKLERRLGPTDLNSRENRYSEKNVGSEFRFNHKA